MRLLAGIVACWLLAASFAVAAEPGVRSLTVREAISSALNHNHRIKSAGYAARAAGESAAIAALSYYPELTFSESLVVSNTPTQAFMMKLDQGRFTSQDFDPNKLNTPAVQHDFKTALSVRQPLYNPADRATRAIADLEAQQGKLQWDGTREEIGFQTFQQCLVVQKTTAHRNASKLALLEAEENVRLARVRNQVGTGLKSDELRARTELSSRELQLLRAENNLKLAKKRLELLTGITDLDKVEISGAEFRNVTHLSSSELTRKALEERSDLRRLRAEQEKSDAQARLIRSSRYPSLDAFASYQLNSKDAPFARDNDGWAAGVQLSWQLFDGFKRYRQRDRAVLAGSMATENLQQMEAETALQLQETEIRHAEAEKRLEVARLAIADAEESVRLLKKRFENSLATMLELLDAQSVLNQSRSNLAEAEADYQGAGGQVYYTAGIFLKEMMQ